MMQDLLPSFLSPPPPLFFFFLHPKPFEHELLNKEVGSINRLCDSFAKNELFRRRAIQHWRIWYSFCPSHTMMVFCSLVDVFLDWRPRTFPSLPVFLLFSRSQIKQYVAFPRQRRYHRVPIFVSISNETRSIYLLAITYIFYFI